MICPVHYKELVGTCTKYGERFACPENGCTAVWWSSGPTSTPADQETRDLRHKCHEVFDPLWQDKTRFASRKSAYRWLRRELKIKPPCAHIGMFDAEQCRRLLAELERDRVRNLTP